ncbi:hypothetical protein CDD81_172 [Ophiocordyceps australis]|uniref:Uncharacterized protein n=1 Tax=Ophiocordyceps australis TaxID=1399860 RepID=A0A2C5XBG8_9HYPO|nr:hypothetical protein CDD81_172 [Ophiocordyceps australis]
MQSPLFALFLLAVPFGLAAPAAPAGNAEPALERRQITAIISDHNKWVGLQNINAAARAGPMPDPLREAHRGIHVGLGPANAIVPPL